MIDTSRIHGNRMVGMEANIVKFGRGGVLGGGLFMGLLQVRSVIIAMETYCTRF
jgi:hypothetical protein